MKNIKLFNTHSEYSAFVQGGNIARPNISYCRNTNEALYNRHCYDYSLRCLTFEALEDCVFTLYFGYARGYDGEPNHDSTLMTDNFDYMSYSTDNGATWVTYTNVWDGSSTVEEEYVPVTITSPTIRSGEKIIWKGCGSVGVMSEDNGESDPHDAYGWEMYPFHFSSTGRYKVYGNIDSLLNDGDFTESTNQSYQYIFEDEEYLEDASDLILRVKNGTRNFEGMFFNCTSLTATPMLPSTTLTTKCYAHMFSGCYSLTEAPILPSTTLANYCYDHMFNSCNSLTTLPNLPSTTLVSNCYQYMFNNCRNLTIVPSNYLPATTLGSDCYSNMFNGCTSLTTPPVLPATTLASSCYSNMFSGCTALTTAPALPATTLGNWCYSHMFSGCTSLTTAPTTLPATIVTDYCYYNMFYGCTALITPPTLPATTLAESCYKAMFYGCRNLTTAPTLPAATLVSRCYYEMFRNCSHLNYIKAMFTTTPSTTYTQNWVYGVASSGTFVKNSAASWVHTYHIGTYGVPSGWTVQTASE